MIEKIQNNSLSLFPVLSCEHTDSYTITMKISSNTDLLHVKDHRKERSRKKIKNSQKRELTSFYFMFSMAKTSLEIFVPKFLLEN